MIFRSETIRLIESGQVTQTRRLAREAREVRRAGRRRTHQPFRPQVDAVYSVQARPGARPRAHVRVTGYRREPAGAILNPDRARELRAEGHASPASFARAWLATHEPAWPRELVTCPGCLGDPDRPDDMLPPCDLCDGAGELRITVKPTDEEVLGRFIDRWAHRPCWVIQFQALATAPRFLAATGAAARPRRTKNGLPAPVTNEEADEARGYTQSAGRALPGELEAVTDQELGLYTRDAHTRHDRNRKGIEARARRAREHQPLDARIDSARAAASANYCREAVDVILQTVYILRKRGHSDEAVLPHVRAAERLAYREQT